MWLVPRVGLHHPLDVTFAIRTNPFTLERSVVAKSRSSSEKSGQDTGTPPRGDPCWVVRGCRP